VVKVGVFRVQPHYIRGANEKWSNVWHCFAASVVDAGDAATGVMLDPLRSVLNPDCTLVDFLISDESSSAFSVISVNQIGTSDAGGDMLPLFNSVKVLFPVSLGRPDLKYIKGFLTEDLQTDGNVNSATVGGVATIFQDLINAMVANSTGLCTGDGVGYGTTAVQIPVQMRQMHRKRRRVILL
jgi:hypothetical protein